MSTDAENRLTSFRTALTAGYSTDGLRAWKQNSSGVQTYFLYDGIMPVCELASNGTVAAFNTFGVAGLLSRHTTANGGNSTFYTFDPTGNVTQRVSSAGVVLASQMFDAFGARSSTDNSTDPFSGYGAQAGYYTDSETGLQLCGHRYYDAAAGRFLNRDPIGFNGGINIYNYVGNNPGGSIDPSGFGFWGGVVGGVIGVGIGIGIGTGLLVGAGPIVIGIGVGIGVGTLIGLIGEHDSPDIAVGSAVGGVASGIASGIGLGTLIGPIIGPFLPNPNPPTVPASPQPWKPDTDPLRPPYNEPPQGWHPYNDLPGWWYPNPGNDVLPPGSFNNGNQSCPSPWNDYPPGETWN